MFDTKKYYMEMVTKNYREPSVFDDNYIKKLMTKKTYAIEVKANDLLEANLKAQRENPELKLEASLHPFLFPQTLSS